VGVCTGRGDDAPGCGAVVALGAEVLGGEDDDGQALKVGMLDGLLDRVPDDSRLLGVLLAPTPKLPRNMLHAY
jgi:hypothetical protein